MCSLMAFGSRIECHASKNNNFHHWEQRSIILTRRRQGQNHDCFFIQCWVNKEFLSPVKITPLCSLVLDLKALDVWPI